MMILSLERWFKIKDQAVMVEQRRRELARIGKLEGGGGERWTETAMSVRRKAMVKQVALEVREHIVIMTSGEAVRGPGEGERRGMSREGGRRLDITEGEETTELCGEKEGVVDTTAGSNAAENTRELATLLERDIGKKLEVKGQTEPDKGQGARRTITNQMLTQQKINLLLDVRGKRSRGMMLPHQLRR